MTGDVPVGFDDWVRTRLFDRRTVLVSGTLDTDLATAAAAELMTLDATGDEGITVHLDCGESGLEAAFTLIDVIDLVGVPVTTVCVGRLAGPAVGVLAVGERRLALPHASFHLTEPRSSFSGHADDVAGWAAQYRKLLDRFVARLAEATGRGEAELAEDLRAGRHLDAAEARRYGLVDETSFW